MSEDLKAELKTIEEQVVTLTETLGDRSEKLDNLTTDFKRTQRTVLFGFIFASVVTLALLLGATIAISKAEAPTWTYEFDTTHFFILLLIGLALYCALEASSRFESAIAEIKDEYPSSQGKSTTTAQTENKDDKAEESQKVNARHVDDEDYDIRLRRLTKARLMAPVMFAVFSITALLSSVHLASKLIQ